MIGLGAVYVLTGAVLGAIAALSASDRSNPKRWANAGFWGLFAASFLLGDHLGNFGNGVLVLVMVAIAGFRGLGLGCPATTTQDQRLSLSREFGNRLFLAALTIPGITLLGSFALKNIIINGEQLFDPGQTTLISFALSAVVAVLIARIVFRQKVIAALQEGGRLMDMIGWAALLPQMLAALGAVFALAGVGNAVGAAAAQAIPMDSRFAAIAAYTIGMALFTAIMGNAFAAFPVMTAGIGLPLIVMKFGGNPAIMSAIGMLSGFCGTLTTPMAANFNLVPAALLQLEDRYAVIKAQIPTAIAVLLINTVLMYALVFRF